MVYIELHDEWYCIECQEDDRIWYHSHGNEEDRRKLDDINYYYEHKEKFEKKYLNRNIREIDK